MMNIGEYNISSSITLGLTIYSLMMIPLAILETFLGQLLQEFLNKKIMNFCTIYR